MRRIYLFFVLLVILAGCTTLPKEALHSQNISQEKKVKSIESDFDMSYKIDYYLAEKSKDDFVSIEVDSLLYKSRLDFDSSTAFKSILEYFFNILEIAKKDNITNGAGILGDTELYCYVYSKTDEKLERYLIENENKNHLEFGFLLKENKAYLVINTFSSHSLNKKNKLKPSFESLPISFEDVKLLYDFIKDEERLENLRMEKLNEKYHVPIPLDSEAEPIS